MNGYAEHCVGRELMSDEQLLWVGQPGRGWRLRPADAFLIPFALVWTGFAIFWEIMALFMVAPAGRFGLIFPLFGLPFVLVGLYMLAGRFWLDARRRAFTCYGLTDRRAIIVSGQFRRTVKSVELAGMTDLSMTEHWGGRGSIHAGPRMAWPGMWYGWGGPGMWFDNSSNVLFELIVDARSVFRLIREARRPTQPAGIASTQTAPASDKVHGLR